MEAELWCVLGGERTGARTGVSGSPAGWCTRWLTDAGDEAPGGEAVGAPDWLALHCKSSTSCVKGGLRARRARRARRRASAWEVDRLRVHLIRRASGIGCWLGL